jgi:hypothetical protein
VTTDEVTFTLAEFLATGDLDLLVEARAGLGDLDHSDRQIVVAVLDADDDLQAVSNLLMHPDLIPSPHRVAQVLRALAGDSHDYSTLAAAVGAARLADLPDTTTPERELISHALQTLATHGDGLTARRAAVSLTSYRASGGEPPLLDHLPNLTDWQD